MLNRNLADVAPQIFSTRLHVPRSPATSIVEILRSGLHGFAAWRNRRREYEFLSSDHRAAADIGYRHRRE